MSAPPRCGSPDELAAIQRYFETTGYTEATVCRGLGIPKIAAFDSPAADMRPDFNTSFFLLGRPVDRKTYSANVPGEVARVFESLGVVGERKGAMHSTVALYPTRGLYVASDRMYKLDGSSAPPTGDFVFLTITPNSQQFIELLPETPCETFLDLGCGAGLAALLASRYTKRVFATDITERSCRFTEFNAALNGIMNITAVRGDMYEPVRGETFDRIAAHMPFYPSLKNLGVYVDGGEDGEAITRRAIEGLPGVLRPGGRFYALTMVSDRGDDKPAEDRVRQWLGKQQDEFDVALIVRNLTEPRQFAMEAVFLGGGDGRAAQEYAERFQRIGISQFVYTHVVIERHGEQRPSYTIRRQMTDSTKPRDVEWLLDWEGRPGSLDPTLVPRLSDRAELTVKHGVEAAELVPRSYEFSCTHPFIVQMECRSWMAQLAAQCRGKMTVAEIQQIATSKGMPEEQFVAAMRALISTGIVTVETRAHQAR